jgi:hypothetical protein
MIGAPSCARAGDTMSTGTRIASFAEFYPYYLGEHRHPTCRRLHFLGTSLVIIVVVTAIATARPALLWAVPLVGYGPAWAGHFFFEKNRPATFSYPLWSLAADWVMYWETLAGRRAF